jgi:hypothetical protein
MAGERNGVMGLLDVKGYGLILIGDPVHLGKYISLKKYSIQAPIFPGQPPYNRIHQLRCPPAAKRKSGFNLIAEGHELL